MTLPTVSLPPSTASSSIIKTYSDLRILDMSQGVAGPYCAMIFGEQGADVIKVEPPVGDWSRVLGQQVDGMTPLSFAYNLGKRSICIDAHSDKGRDLILQMAAKADVIIESFRPGVMERLGLSYTALSKNRPDLVYVSVTGFGQDGPYVDRPGSDSTLQAMSGMMVANRDAQGHPRKIDLLVADIATGVYAAQAVGAALYRRLAHGVGAHVDISLLDVAAALQNGAIIDQALANWKTVTPYSVPAGTFETQDGYINVTSLHDRMFIGLCKAIGKNDWMTDARFATAVHRFELADEIYDTLRQVFLEQPTSHWMTVMREHGVVCGKISDYAEFIEDPHVRHRQVFRDGETLGFGPMPIAQLPGALCKSAATQSPRCGENTKEILEEMGLGGEALQVLFAEGVVAAWKAGEP